MRAALNSHAAGLQFLVRVQARSPMAKVYRRHVLSILKVG